MLSQGKRDASGIVFQRFQVFLDSLTLSGLQWPWTIICIRSGSLHGIRRQVLPTGPAGLEAIELSYLAAVCRHGRLYESAGPGREESDHTCVSNAVRPRTSFASLATDGDTSTTLQRCRCMWCGNVNCLRVGLVSGECKMGDISTLKGGR